MCEDCLKEEYPDRDTMCLESGSYLLNYAGCASCGNKASIINSNERTTREAVLEEEMITYQHTCGDCNHVIANHEYTFRIEDDYQVYEMQCALCGSAEDQRSIMPWDPRVPK